MERRKKLKGSSSPLQDESTAEAGEIEDSDYMDDEMKAKDNEAQSRIRVTLSEHLTDLEIVQNNSGLY